MSYTIHNQINTRACNSANAIDKMIKNNNRLILINPYTIKPIIGFISLTSIDVA